ncbi:MAG TPA: RNA-binding protein [Thermoanaerobaculia bacterium]|nr:RNA-binding protein [Thermoanaerobaculia bacterium]
MAAKLFVGNLSFRATREEIEGLFAQCGTIKDLFLPTDAESGRLRGFAFVEFESEEDAARAMEKFNGYELGGRALRVNAAEERPPRRPGFSPRMPSGGGGGGGDRFGGGGGGGGGAFGGGKSKGSRRNIRAKKRQL